MKSNEPEREPEPLKFFDRKMIAVFAATGVFVVYGILRLTDTIR